MCILFVFQKAIVNQLKEEYNKATKEQNDSNVSYRHQKNTHKCLHWFACFVCVTSGRVLIYFCWHLCSLSLQDHNAYFLEKNLCIKTSELKRRLFRMCNCGFKITITVMYIFQKPPQQSVSQPANLSTKSTSTTTNHNNNEVAAKPKPAVNPPQPSTKPSTPVATPVVTPSVTPVASPKPLVAIAPKPSVATAPVGSTPNTSAQLPLKVPQYHVSRPSILVSRIIHLSQYWYFIFIVQA